MQPQSGEITAALQSAIGILTPRTSPASGQAYARQRKPTDHTAAGLRSSRLALPDTMTAPS